jgi:hypothetical protein
MAALKQIQNPAQHTAPTTLLDPCPVRPTRNGFLWVAVKRAVGGLVNPDCDASRTLGVAEDPIELTNSGYHKASQAHEVYTESDNAIPCGGSDSRSNRRDVLESLFFESRALLLDPKRDHLPWTFFDRNRNLKGIQAAVRFDLVWSFWPARSPHCSPYQLSARCIVGDLDRPFVGMVDKPLPWRCPIEVARAKLHG